MANQQLQRYFIGFSTQQSSITGIRTLYDIDLIKTDIMASFQTRVGERVMRPDYGCKLWDYLMEPLTSQIRADIIDESERIVKLDSRCTFLDSHVFELAHGFKIEITVQYEPWKVSETFAVTFEQSNIAYFS